MVRIANVRARQMIDNIPKIKLVVSSSVDDPYKINNK